ncbi:hypothetical protein RN001_010006 [Aquatica leii]|uniref:Enoyl-CoA hydratase n=1 Tax=Aquatica leii TaxID=1421715 RepID=A0AAN7SQ51_9COLE|nr:hypothetical protein RN001_010006 [Aquatica leii]
MSTTKSEDLLIFINEGVRIIKFNRPSKKNAITLAMYIELTNTLNNDATNDNIVLTILTGVGDYYSSGNDLTISYSNEGELVNACQSFQGFVTALINYPKLIIAVVNGPAIGIAVTTLALCDVVYATDQASFATPFVRLGICPEACSSYLLPRIMGRSRASELLLLGHKLTAEEAYSSNLISKVIPQKQLPEFLNYLHKYSKLSVDSIKTCKKLIKDCSSKDLHEINDLEAATLFQCASGEDSTKYLKLINKL